MLSINNLKFSLNNKILFNDLSVTFNDGEIIGITGAAGSGKSKFIDLLRNNEFTYEGSIFVDENDIKKVKKKKLKNLISHYSSVQNIINPEAIVKEWILTGRNNHKKIFAPYSDTDVEITRREMSYFGLDQLAEIRLKLISETSRRMASMARVFSAQSKILLLEKPDTGLNINQRILLSKCIKKYSSNGSKIVILTSSDLNFIAATCDRIITFDNNNIAASGTHLIITGEFIKKYFKVEAIVTKNIYSGLPEIQIIE